MSYDTSDIKQAIKEYYMREIEDNNLVYKGRASRINSLHHWKENDLKYFEKLERKAKAFDEIIELETRILKYIDRPHLLINQIMDIVWQYERGIRMNDQTKRCPECKLFNLKLINPNFLREGRLHKKYRCTECKYVVIAEPD